MSVEGSGLDGGLRCHPDRSNTSPILNSKDISLKIGAVSVNISGFFSTLLVIRTVPQFATRGGGECGWLREGSIPLRFQGGVAAPLIKRSRSSAAQTGWLVKGRVASI